MHKILLIIKREYITRVRKKSFILLTLLGPLLIAGVTALVIWFGMKNDQVEQVLVVDQLNPVFESLNDNEQLKFEYSDLTDDQAFKLFPESHYTALLLIPKDILNVNRALLYFKDQPSARVQRDIEARVERIVEQEKLRKYGIDPSDFAKVNTNFKISAFKFTETGEKEAIQGEKAFIGFAFGIAIYMFIFLYGVQVMRGVIEEKTNRIVEVIITSVKPFQLMMGKIIGVALVGLTQFILWIILTTTVVTAVQSVLLADRFEELTTMQQTVSQLDKANPEIGALNTNEDQNPLAFLDRINFPLMIGMFLFYFLGGYLLYSSLFAAIGAAVDSETDTQQFMFPVTIPLLLAYFLSIAIMENPSGPAAIWGSIIPLTSPIIMMVRIAIGIESGDLWQLYLSMFLLVAGFVFTTWLAGKIYRTGILMYGKKVSYKELWKWLKHND